MTVVQREVVYPESDGNPIAENTLQFEWLTSLKWGFDALFMDNPDVFVAGDLLWYPVEGNNKIRVAPDVLIAFGRPKGHRESYKQWAEGGIAPQIVWEVLSPGNSTREMIEKGVFYDRHGVEEFYLYDPQTGDFTAIYRPETTQFLERSQSDLPLISPRLGVRFERGEQGELVVIRPDGERFKTYTEILQERNQMVAERNQLATERDDMVAERNRAIAERDEERQRVAAAEEQTRVLLARLQELESANR